MLSSKFFLLYSQIRYNIYLTEVREIETKLNRKLSTEERRVIYNKYNPSSLKDNIPF